MLIQQWIVYFNMLDGLLFNSRRLEVARTTLRLDTGRVKDGQLTVREEVFKSGGRT